MANITIVIPDTILQRILEGFAYQHGYEDEIPDIGPGRKDVKKPNPESKQQFVKRTIKRLILQSVRSYEIRRAEEVARHAKEVEFSTIDLDVS